MNRVDDVPTLSFSYAVTNLSTLGGSSSYADAVSASGQVAGTANPAGAAISHASLYSGGK